MRKSEAYGVPLHTSPHAPAPTCLAGLLYESQLVKKAVRNQRQEGKEARQ